MTARKKPHDPMHGGRRDRLIEERIHDPYKPRKKLPEPSVCRKCGVVWKDGRWTWGEAPADSHETLCPACQRIRDKVPAAFVVLEGDFLRQHKDEILHLVRNAEEAEKVEHPMNRIMDLREEDGRIEITTTDAHLARVLGEKIHAAYKGEVTFEYTKGEDQLRVHWSRNL